MGNVTVERDVPVPMRDGTVLRADVYRPQSGGEFPALVLRTPYDKTSAQQVAYQHPVYYARHGYLVVVQDVRGRYASAGTFVPYQNEAADGADTIAWAARLDRCTGRVGTYGFSYAGAAQLLAAAEQPAALACAAPAFTSSDFYRDWTYVGGVLNHAFVVSWVLQMLAIPDLLRTGGHDAAARVLAAQERLPHLYRSRPLAELAVLRDTGAAGYFFDWLEHDTYDDYWRAVSIRERHARIGVPCLHIGGWYDTFVEGTLDNFTGLTTSDGPDEVRHRLIVGPWAHSPWGRRVGGRDFGAAAGGVVDRAQLAWFDHWLKDRPLDGSPVRVFVMGADRWYDAPTWPMDNAAVQEWYLHAEHGAQSVSGDGRLDRRPPAQEPPDAYVAMPARPVPSAGGRSSSDPAVVPMGPADQSAVEGRHDVLVYTTAQLAQDMEVIGTVWLVLYAATDGLDCDWMAKLVDVDEGGGTVNLCDGAVRAQLHDSLSQPRSLRPGEVYEYRVRVGSTAYRFRRGHRLRLLVSSSNFPQYAVNPQTGERASHAGPFSLRMATQTVFHDATRPSRLELPVTAGVRRSTVVDPPGGSPMTAAHPHDGRPPP